MPVTVRLDNVRLAYANVWEKRVPEDGGEARYDAVLLIDKTNTSTIAALKKAVEEAKEEGKTKKWNGKIPPNFSANVHQGDDKVNDDGEIREGFEGTIYVNAKAQKSQPIIVGANRKPITDQSLVYSGCYANVVVNLYPYASQGNKGVGFGLEAIQKVADGEPFGGVIDVNSVFDDISDGADVDDTADTGGSSSNDPWG